MRRRVLPPNFHSHEHGGIAAPPRLLLLPGYTVLPFLRASLGYGIVHPRHTLIRAGALILVPVILEFFWVGLTRAPVPHSGRLPYLSLFALAYLTVSLPIFARRWYGQRHAEEIHTAEAGYSWLAWYTPLPVPLCEIVIVPGCVFAIGYLLTHTISFELGWWLIAAGISLFAMALWEHRRVWSQHRATVDDLLRSKVFEARVDRASPPKSAASRDEGPDFADLA